MYRSMTALDTQAFGYLQIRTQAGAVIRILSSLSSLNWLAPTSTTCGKSVWKSARSHMAATWVMVDL